MKKGETLKTKLCKLKPMTEKEDKDVEYIISCQICGIKYWRNKPAIQEQEVPAPKRCGKQEQK